MTIDTTAAQKRLQTELDSGETVFREAVAEWAKTTTDQEVLRLTEAVLSVVVYEEIPYAQASLTRLVRHLLSVKAEVSTS